MVGIRRPLRGRLNPHPERSEEMTLGTLPYKPGDHPNDHRYLFEGHPHVLTEAERGAWRNLLVARKIKNSGSGSMKRMLDRTMSINNPAAEDLLRNGEAAFYTATFARVLAEQTDQLNTCPKCGSLCRTVKACLCPHCSHTWFEKRQKAEQSGGEVRG